MYGSFVAVSRSAVSSRTPGVFKLPKITVFMMSASNLLLNYWPYWIVGAVALVLTYVFGHKTEPGRKILDWLKINLPIIGRLTRKVTLSRCVVWIATAGVSPNCTAKFVVSFAVIKRPPALTKS